MLRYVPRVLLALQVCCLLYWLLVPNKWDHRKVRDIWTAAREQAFRTEKYCSSEVWAQQGGWEVKQGLEYVSLRLF
jgi:hypothetical protein